ncbi:HAMP domain-containing histidine kinase [Listeria grandensis]|uniref:histidine kinase n=1 Tax=Listeria grandensis TaxID=1494963 RepID=A0A7X0Y5J0_9LIST|nr:HAMP domain-containing sensor histidine kinase [Listeria grandensis]MBC1475850.1 HAMP domain-containing histidine kinase [Listeria grandensis]MBC1937385.1 HAMP domain-containing histidine kinase [Listeria grandensis]
MIYLLGAIIVVLLVWIILIKKQLRTTSAKIKDIATRRGSNEQLTMDIASPEIRQLLLTVNELLEAKSKTERKFMTLNKELRETIENVSHDLRTPLTSLSGYLQLMERDTLTPEEREKYSLIIKNKIQTLTELVENFFVLSKLSNDEGKLQPEPIQLSDFVTGAVASYYEDFSKRGITPELLVEPDVTINADRKALQRMVDNFISNMLKHGEGPMKIELAKQGRKAVLRFSNQASQLTQADIPRLIERFYTADRVRSGSNTGLGLAIIDLLAHKSGAAFTVDFEEEVLTFTVIFK